MHFRAYYADDGSIAGVELVNPQSKVRISRDMLEGVWDYPFMHELDDDLYEFSCMNGTWTYHLTLALDERDDFIGLDAELVSEVLH